MRPIGVLERNTSSSTCSRPSIRSCGLGRRLLASEVPRDGALQRVVDQRRLARAADAGDDRQGPEREARVDALQVEAASTVDLEEAAVAGAALVGRGHLQLTAQESPGRGVGRGHVRRSPGRDHLAAVSAGTGTDVDQPVGRAQGGLVVLDHDDRIADVTQLLESAEQPSVVSRVQADRGLVEDVEHALQPGAELGRQTDALGLAAGQGVRRALQREVAQAHVHQERRPAARSRFRSPSAIFASRDRSGSASPAARPGRRSAS